MLAVQCPSMGSSKPPNLEMPFGYSFDDSGSNLPFPSPTAPAPGPSLLDDNESKFLDNFFDGVSSDQFNYDVFNLEDGCTTGIGWQDLPPTFIGSTSSYGQHIHAGFQNGLRAVDFGQVDSHFIPGAVTTSAASNEVLQAAPLLQSVPNECTHDLSSEEILRNRESQFLPVDSSAVAETIPQPLSVLQPIFEPRSSVNNYANEIIQANVAFDDQMTALIRNRRENARADIRWGSDAAFATPQGFTTPFSRESVSATERYHLRAIETALSIPRNIGPAETSYLPHSMVRRGSVPRRRVSVNSLGHCTVEEEEEENLVMNKRRKIEEAHEEDDDDDNDDDDDLQASSQLRNRTPVKHKKAEIRELVDKTTLNLELGHKRRRSTAGAASKSTRENLTEEQKRENHIRSEQKRRTLIREGFEDLNELVPGLQGGGFSKSAVLAQAADWLEDLIRGNESLREKILLMEGRVAPGSS